MYYGIAATVCHFLRKRGEPDPSRAADDSEWNDFFNWVTQQFARTQFFRSKKAWIDMKEEFFNKEKRTAILPFFAKEIILSADLLKMCWYKLYGTGVASTLAKKWINDKKKGQFS